VYQHIVSELRLHRSQHVSYAKDQPREVSKASYLNLNPAVAGAQTGQRQSAQPIVDKWVITNQVKCAAVGSVDHQTTWGRRGVWTAGFRL